MLTYHVASMCLFRGRRRRIREIPRGTTQSDARGICLRGMSRAGMYVNPNAIRKTIRLHVLVIEHIMK